MKPTPDLTIPELAERAGHRYPGGVSGVDSRLYSDEQLRARAEADRQAYQLIKKLAREIQEKRRES